MIRNATRCMSMLVALLLVGSTAAMATTHTNYSVAPVSGTYTELGFGTVHATGTAIDNQVVSNVGLGFNFTVGNTVYSTVNVHANGYITFGGTGFSGGTYAPLTSGETADAVIAAWAGNLVGTTSGEIRTALLGGPGAYTFVIQWKGMTRQNDYGSDDAYNFQIRLNQSNNSIDVVYGSMTVNAPYASQIGMRGTAGNGSYGIRADYDRNTWANPSIQTTGATYATSENGFAPASGQTYRFVRRVAPGSNNDAGILWVATADGPYSAGVQQTIVARVKNWGTVKLDSVIVEWKVNGVTRTAAKYYPQPNGLAPNAEATINLGYATFNDKSWNTLWASTISPNGQNDVVPENNGYTTWTAPTVSGTLSVATVGVNAGVFTRVRDVVRHLNVSGISGNVNVHVYEGTYTENLNLTPIWSATGSERVMFMAHGDGNVEITGKMHGSYSTYYDPLEWPYLVNLNGVSNVTFDGITFRIADNSYTQSTIIGNQGVTNITFDGCSFIGRGYNYTIGYAIELWNGFNGGLTVENCTIDQHYVGLYTGLFGGASSTISNNTITAGYGMLVQDGTAGQVSGNTITVPSTLNYYGGALYCYSVGTTISNNVVNASAAPFGADGIANTTDFGNSSTVFNNMVSVGGSGNSSGLYVENYGGTARYYHNTVNMVGSAGNAASYAMYIYNANTDPLRGTEVVNNILHNAGTGSNGGYAIGVQGTSTNSLRVSDFNDIVTTGTTLAVYGGVNRTNIAAWRTATGRDFNSVSTPVAFVGGSDLHLLNIQPALWGANTLFGTVSTDIDGEPRRKPYMGADEVLPSIQIVQQPISRYACIGESFTLTCIAEVTPGATVKYQWYKDDILLANRTSAILSLTGVGYPAAGVYTCVIEATDGTTTVTDTSDGASVYVVRRTEVTQQPASRPVALGSTVDLTVAVEAVGAPQDYVPSYQWKKKYWSVNTNSYQDSIVVDNGRITGATSSILTIRDVNNTDTLDQYFCTIVGYCGTVDTKTARLFIPKVLVSNTTPAACTNTTIVLECAALPSSVAGASVGYQWYKDGSMVMDDARTSGSMSKVLMINGAVDTLDNGEYWCVATYNPSGVQIPSNTVDVAVGTSPIIVLQPEGDTLCEGASLTLAAQGQGTGIMYQWMKGGAVISNATGAALTVQNVTAADAGSYSVMIINSCGQATSQTVDVLVNVRPTITEAPSDKAVTEGDEIKLEVTAAGSGTLTYQWYKGTTMIPNADGATFTVARATGDDQGDYVVVVSNECGSDTSDVARVGVTVGVTGDVAENGFVLGMANPNPTNDAVSFGYTVPVSQNVRISLTDMLGREIAQLVNGSVDAGTHRVEFSASALNLNAGVYLYTITTGGFAATQQVIIVK
jgi:hypothetical protein